MNSLVRVRSHEDTFPSDLRARFSPEEKARFLVAAGYEVRETHVEFDIITGAGPVEYSSPGQCVVIGVWTRAGQPYCRPYDWRARPNRHAWLDAAFSVEFSRALYRAALAAVAVV